MSAAPILCVDLDGTLVRTDLLVEAVLILCRTHPWCLLLLPLWLLRGKAYVKHQIARRTHIDPASLPYNEAFLAFLQAEKQAGRRLILTSASPERWVEAVAQHVKIFDDLIASTALHNVAGGRKLQAIRQRVGNAAFDYAGNAAIDLEIWPGARGAILVNAPAGVRRKAEASARVQQVFCDTHSTACELLKAMRAQQWLKNFLVFVPFFMTPAVSALRPWFALGLAFLAFSLCASAACVLNDLCDLAHDRAHSTKRHRPFAAGSLPLVVGIGMVPVLLALAVLLSTRLPGQFLVVLGLYFSMATAYALFLKRLRLLDVLTRACLYTLRLVAGAAAVAIAVPFRWLACAMVLFLSLALVKRYTALPMLVARICRGKRGNIVRKM